MNEKEYLKELGKRYRELAVAPVMAERADLWRRHNDGDKNCAPVIIEVDSFLSDLLPPLRCEDPFHRELEQILLTEIVRAEEIGDDRVIPEKLELPMRIRFRHLDYTPKVDHASEYGFHTEPIILDIEQDLAKLRRSVYSYDPAEDRERLERANEILPAELSNQKLRWLLVYTKYVVDLMGMEPYFFAMFDYPEKVHELMEFLRTDLEDYILWQEKEGLLTPNNGNHYVGSGSYGFTGALSGEPVLRQMWGNMNSQESVSVSPEMFGEFVYPYYEKTARLFGKVYWGCCEPVDKIWDRYISRLPNLAKVSISAWCDEEVMGEKLKDSPVIYSRKPSPNFVGVPDVFDGEAFAAHIRKTARAARDCNVEIIMRDIYTLKGDRKRAKRAVDIARAVINAR